MALIRKLIDQITGMVVGGPPRWRHPGHARRRDVLHYARQGRPDPDPAVWAIAVDWARWWLAVPRWRQLLRATVVALGVDVAITAAFLASVPLLLIVGGSFEVARGYGWIVRTGLQLGLLVYAFAVIPWLDARKILRLSASSAPGEAISG